MNTEIEAKFTDADKDNIRAKLKAEGAKIIQSECVMRRRNYDYPDGRLGGVGAWTYSARRILGRNEKCLGT